MKRNPYNSEKRRKELDRKKKKEEKKQKKIDRLNQVIDPLTGLPVVEAVLEQADGLSTDPPGDQAPGGQDGNQGSPVV